jgi:hypothetical protein
MRNQRPPWYTPPRSCQKGSIPPLSPAREIRTRGVREERQQISVKFQVTSRDTSAGCVLALPKPVWDSWQPFLGAPELHQTPDGTWRLLDDRTATPNNWIYVFDIGDDASPDGGPAPVNVCLVIGTDAPTLSRAAFDVAPARAVEHGAGTDAVVSSIVRRLRAHIPVVLSPE